LTKRAEIFPILVLLLLFSAFFVQGIFLIQDTSPTTDEVAFHMVNGYTYLKTQDYRMSPANPPLLRQWMALPWLALQPVLDLTKTSWKEADSVPFAQEFFYKDNRPMADTLLYSARFMILLLGAWLGAVIFCWAKRLYGIWGGLLSLSFYVFSPALLAHASIAHTDIGVTFFVALAAYALWNYFERSSVMNLCGFALALGLACAAKYNALFLAPIFLITILIKKGFLKFILACFLFACFAFLVIWAGYFFEFKPLLAGGVPRVDEKLASIASISNALFPGNEAILKFFQKTALETPIPIPSYILGIAGIVRSHQSGYLHYAFGQWREAGVWYTYLFSFATKMTLPFLGLLLFKALTPPNLPLPRGGTISPPWQGGARGGLEAGHENWVILPPVFFLFLMTCFDSTGVGVRYLFPVTALLMVWAGGLVRVRSLFLKVGVGFLAAANIVVAGLSFPNYLSYFNGLVGQNGWRYIRGSDVDWGQGLKGLKKYLDERKIDKVALRYFGTADPSFYGISHEPLTDEEMKTPQAKVYAISVFNLEHAAWAPSTKPTAVIKGSIFVYDFRK
jgi:hypothetical protein